MNDINDEKNPDTLKNILYFFFVVYFNTQIYYCLASMKTFFIFYEMGFC